jgi:glycosyltransferase involved in cell wall biosynthesis
MVCVSVIVPIYNTARYLSSCLESILNQTFSDFELILVNDGSTDGSLEICEHFVQTDSRIRLVSQSNQGQQAALERGVSLAEGAWLFFVDSDDHLPDNALHNLYDQCDDHTDIIVGFSYPGDGSVRQITIEQWRELQLSSSEILCTRWGKLFRRQIINQEIMQTSSDIRVGEDMIMNIKAAFNTHKPVTVLQDQVYYYNRNATSVSSTYRWTSERFYALYQAVCEAIPSGADSRYYHAAIRNGLGMLSGIIIKGAWKEVCQLKHSSLVTQLRSDINLRHFNPGFRERMILRYPSKWITRQWIRACRGWQILRQYIHRNLLKR